MYNKGDPVAPFDADTWEPVPKWHPRRLFGYTWRRREYRYDDGGDYYYRTDKQLAREHLHNTFGPKKPGDVYEELTGDKLYRPRQWGTGGAINREQDT